VLFVGRLDPEKGVETLLRAWKLLPHIPLKICGEGQLGGWARDFIDTNGLNDCVDLMDRLPAHELQALVKGARFLVWPSQGYYETFGYVAVESFSCGVPVIASRLGVPAEIVTDGSTGLHFDAGVPEDLARAVQWAWQHPGEMARMGQQARSEYESRYTAERSYPPLLQAYGSALERAAQKGYANPPR
jgi:glycosyltransferase involved in cell wall biosynthesis